MVSMARRVPRLTTGQDRGRLSPCVCNTLRMVTRAVTQLYDDVLRPSGLRVTQFSILAAIAGIGEANLKQLEDALAIDQTTLTRSLNLLERDGVIERAAHPDGRIKAMRLTSKGRRALGVARPRWAQAQDKVLRELGTKAWIETRRRLTHLLHVAVKKRRLGRERRRAQPSRAPRPPRQLDRRSMRAPSAARR
ncbi:MAG: MarR family transcriptional regulator [Candidatus Rokuibacteriota bacterium]|nr:MAG: MarR family transcriptional regulator [Candidatus Rokubacteria bacterium]